MMDVAIDILEAERGLLILIDKKTEELKIEIVRGVERKNIENATLISDSIVKEVILKGKSLITSDARTDKRFRDRKSVINYRITSVLCVPLKIKDRIIGAIYLDHRRVSELFDSEALLFLTAFANLAAIAIENARLHEKLQKENVYLRQEIEEKYKFENIVGKSTQMKKLYQLMEKVIDSSTNVLIEGETGTGKEIVARTIHFNGPRRDKKFVAVDCAAIPVTLFESEFFGYKKGAFTGAIRDKEGLFVTADGGTLFLDEITNMSLEAQAKLLRVIQEGEIRPLGEKKFRKIDVRIIAATNKNLKKEVETGNFRTDLYYRLNVITMKLPPLRERKEDIILLANHFLNKYCNKLGKRIKGFTEDAIKILLDYDWPGNVRELEHQIERAVTLSSKDLITKDLFSIKLSSKISFIKEGTLKSAVEELEQAMIKNALHKYKHKKDAAKALGLSRFGLTKKLERYRIK
jgi:Nif-specific regulatory protein